MNVSNGAAILAAFLMLTSLGRDAAAQSAIDAMLRWGLLGTWSFDCSRVPSKDNPHWTYFRRGTKAFDTSNWGGGPGVTMEVEDARIQGSGIELNLIRRPVPPVPTIDHHTRTLIKDADNRIRVMSNRASGKLYIHDGVILENGKPTPWIPRCREVD